MTFNVTFSSSSRSWKACAEKKEKKKEENEKAWNLSSHPDTCCRAAFAALNCNKSEIITARSGVFSRGRVDRGNCRPSIARSRINPALTCRCTIIARPHFISCHQRSDAIRIPPSTGSAIYGQSGDRVINEFCGSDWLRRSENERGRGRERERRGANPSSRRRSERERKREGGSGGRERERREESIAPMQSVAPNEFRTGWKNRWHVIYDDVYINEKCAFGRRHVAAPLRRPAIDDWRPRTCGLPFIVVIINASSCTSAASVFSVRDPLYQCRAIVDR